MSTPSSVTRSTPTRRSQAGAESKGELINVDEMADEEDPEDIEYGFAPLKVCVKAVWAARWALFDRSHRPMLTQGSYKVPIWLTIVLGNGLYIVWILWNSREAKQWRPTMLQANSVAL